MTKGKLDTSYRAGLWITQIQICEGFISGPVTISTFHEDEIASITLARQAESDFWERSKIALKD